MLIINFLKHFLNFLNDELVSIVRQQHTANDLANCLYLILGITDLMFNP